MTAARTPRAPSNVVAEIAARRAADLATELDGVTLASLERQAYAAPPARDIAVRLAGPGLALIAEVKRSSPSLGPIVAASDDPVARARSYAAGGAVAISVLCEPHWFGGSVDDLRRVRAAVSVPVLAKEFVVDRRQLPLLRAAGADLVLLLASLHPAARLARFVDDAIGLGLEPLVEAHDERELERALATRTRLIGLNNRDLRTLDVDPERAVRLRERVPEDRLVIAESGVRDPDRLGGWRALGFDAVLVGEALMRAANPGAAAARFVAAGRLPDDLAAEDRAPLVKICGITDAAGILAALQAGAEAIGLNLVPGTPRALELDAAVELARMARAGGAWAGRPRVVAVTADAGFERLATIIGTLDPDVIQLAGDESLELIRRLDRPVWKTLKLPRQVAAGDLELEAGAIVAHGQAFLAAGAERILLDTAGGPHPGGTGARSAVELAAAVARALPVVLAGGLDPANVGGAVLAIPAIGVDVASGVEYPLVAGQAPRKDPYRVALFAKRARAARWDRPNTAARPTPVFAGLLEADADGRWGCNREYGGRYVPETLMAALEDLQRAYYELRQDPRFWAEFRELLATYSGRPTPLYRADRLAAATLVDAAALLGPDAAAAGRLPTRLRLYLKREDLAHTGAHKINTALGQALLTRRLGKDRVIAETGAGQHGVATATACALLDLPCVVFMGAEDIRRQQPNVLRMRALGAEVRSVTSGTGTLKDAVNEAMREWVTTVETTHYVLGSAMGPHPYPTIVRDLQRILGDESAAQMLAVEGRLPDLVLACVGGGSNAIGILDRFIGEPAVRLAVAEAAGDGIATGRHAAALAGGTPGILHGSRSLMLQDSDGQVIEAHSISAGLDYPGVGPQIAALVSGGRLELAAATDSEALAALRHVARLEGILPALETAHAFAVLPRLVAGLEGSGVPYPDEAVILVGLSGRGDKDLAALEPAEPVLGQA